MSTREERRRELKEIREAQAPTQIIEAPKVAPTPEPTPEPTRERETDRQRRERLAAERMAAEATYEEAERLLQEKMEKAAIVAPTPVAPTPIVSKVVEVPDLYAHIEELKGDIVEAQQRIEPIVPIYTGAEMPKDIIDIGISKQVMGIRQERLEGDITSAETSLSAINKQINMLSADPTKYQIKDPVTGEVRDVEENDITKLKGDAKEIQDWLVAAGVAVGKMEEFISIAVIAPVWTVKVINPVTGKVIGEEKFDSEAEANKWAHYQEEKSKIHGVSPLTPTVKEEIKPTESTILVNPNLVTYMGVSMTREQFEEDFPPDTIPDPPVVPTTEPFGGLFRIYEDAISVIPDSLRDSAKILSERSADASEAGKPWEGFVSYLTSVAYRGSAAAYDTGTFLIRPELWAQQAQTISYLLAADKPITRTQHNQRIADFVAADITDPTMQKDVSEFLQKTVPFMPQKQEDLDKAKKFRDAFATHIAADPFAFAVEVGASIYTGKLIGDALGKVKSNVKEYGKANNFDDAFIQEQLNKVHGLDETPGVTGDIQVTDMFKDMSGQTPTKLGETMWSADLYTKSDPTKVFRSWAPDASKGAFQNTAALGVAQEVSTQGGQLLVLLKDPVTSKVASTISYVDFVKVTSENPTAFAGMGATVAVLDPGGAQAILDKAVEDGVFGRGVTPEPITQNQILVTMDSPNLQAAILGLAKQELGEIDQITLLDVLPKLEPGTITEVIPKLDKGLVRETIPNLGTDVITDILPDLDGDTILAIIPNIDTDIITDVVPKLDTSTIIDVMGVVDTDTIVSILPNLDTDVAVDVIMTLDTDVITDIIPKLGIDVITDIITDVDIDIITIIIPELPESELEIVVQKLEEELDLTTIKKIRDKLMPGVRRRFRQASKRPARRIYRSEKPEPYEIKFQYSTGASETVLVSAHTFPEAEAIAEEQKKIKLVPLEVEVEKL